ncbi:MAG: hypothetical protein ACJ798_14120 [Phenylobacterium sp.]
MHRRRLLALAGLAAILPLAAARAEEKKKKSGGESYLAMDTLTATTIKANGRRGVLTVDCGLDVPDGKLRQYVDQSTPRLRAAYVQVVQTYAAGLGTGTPPNPDFLGRELQRQTDLIIGRPGARLLLGAVVAN